MTVSSLAPDFFVNLPSEVLLTIFGAQESFRDVSSLFRTCKGLYTLWQTRAYSISKPLLVRQTPCYEDVEALVMADEAAHFTPKPQAGLFFADSGSGEKLQRTLYRLAQSRQVAGQAKYLCEIIGTRYLQQKYGCHAANCRTRASVLLLQEREEITRAHHFIKLYALTYTNKSLKDLHVRCKSKLQDMSTADRHFLFQLTRLMHDYTLPWDKMRLGIHTPFSPSGIVDFDTCCSSSWNERFSTLKEATRMPVTTCQHCIYDDTARFGRPNQGEED